MKVQALKQTARANNILYINGFANIRPNMNLHTELSHISSMVAPNTKIDICSLNMDQFHSHSTNGSNPCAKGYYFASKPWQGQFDNQLMDTIEWGCQYGYDGVILDNCGDRRIQDYEFDMPVVDVMGSAISVCQEQKTLSMIVNHKYIIPAIQENLTDDYNKQKISFRAMYDCNLDELFQQQKQVMYYWDRLALSDFVDQVIEEDKSDYVILNCHCDIEAVAIIGQRYPDKIVYPNTCALIQCYDKILNGISNEFTQAFPQEFTQDFTQGINGVNGVNGHGINGGYNGCNGTIAHVIGNTDFNNKTNFLQEVKLSDL